MIGSQAVPVEKFVLYIFIVSPGLVALSVCHEQGCVVKLDIRQRDALSLVRMRKRPSTLVILEVPLALYEHSRRHWTYTAGAAEPANHRIQRRSLCEGGL